MRNLKSNGLSALALVVLTHTPSSPAAGPATTTKPPPAARPVIVLQADAAEPHGVLYATTRPGYTGGAYVTGIDDEKDGLTWHAKSDRGGIYQVEIRYSAPAIKGYDLAVNGVSHEDAFQPSGDAFATHAGGKVELKAGDNLVELRKGWGHYDIDRVELIPTDLPELKKPPATLTDPDATPAAKALLRQLVDDYGKTTRSGVTSPADAQFVLEHAGVTPAIMGGDLIDFSPSRVEHGSTSLDPPERMIADAKAGYLLTVMWHWNAPSHLIDNKHLMKDGVEIDASWYRGFYTEATTFDLEATLKHPDSEDYRLLLRDIDAIAAQLKKFDDAGVPVLWRPLHEADGAWFWWGAKGPDAFKALWSLLHDRLVNHHHLHNLVWVYTASTKWDWYPPANEFDVIGVDFYPKDPHDPDSAMWDALQARWGDQKLIAMTEIGGVPDLAAMARLGERWSYFASWGGKLGPEGVAHERLKALYTAATIANRPATRPTNEPAAH